MPITAAEFDRLAEQGRDGRFARFFSPITAVELRREIENSRKQPTR
jgi:hypothetical protein